MTTAPTPSASRRAAAEASGSLRQQHDVGGARVRAVDAGVRAHEAVAGAADQPAAVRAQELDGLVEDHLHVARVLAVLGRQGAGAVARLDVRERAHAALGLGDDLVRDREHVGRAELQPRRRAGRRGRRRGGPRGGPRARRGRASRGVDEPLEQRARARAPASRARSAVRSASRSPGVSTSSSSDGSRPTRTRAPAALASAAWRANEPGPKAGAITVGGAISRAFVPDPWRSGTITTPSESSASSASTSAGSSTGQSPGTSSTRSAPRSRAAWTPSEAAADCPASTGSCTC